MREAGVTHRVASAFRFSSSHPSRRAIHRAAVGAEVVVVLVPVVALLDRSAGESVPACRQATGGGAGRATGAAPAVAQLARARIERAVATNRRRAIRIACRAGTCVVALFARVTVHGAVAAQGHGAVRIARAALAGGVATLTARDVYRPVSAERRGAIRVTRRGRAAGVALLAGIHDAVAARLIRAAILGAPVTA